LNELERALHEAVDGDDAARRRFLEILLNSSVVAAERRQAGQLSHQPRYPQTPFNFLAIQSEDRVYIPIFSSESRLREWFDRDLNLRSTPFPVLLDSIPDDWWLYLNPDAPAQKEFSPWELALLKKGGPGIAEVIQELNNSDDIPPLNLQALADDQALELRTELTVFFNTHDDVTKIFMLKEPGPLGRIVIGLELKGDRALIKTRREEAAHKANKIQIGQDPVMVIAGMAGSSELSLFRFAKPFLERRGASWLARLAASWGL